MVTNSFGLDSAYFADKLSLVLRDLGSFKPEELARALARMARTACEEVLGEAEFSGLPKTVDLPSGEAYIGWMTDAERARMVEGMDEIGALSRHLRNGGCDNTDLQGLEDGLTHAIDIANELLGTLAAPAAPVPAAQEPVAEVRHTAIGCVDWISFPRDIPSGTKLYTAPPAAEQPYSTTSDRYRAELYDEVWEKARALGFGNVTEALADLEQPDTVKAPRELLACAARSCANGWVDYLAAKELRALLGKEGE